MSYVSFWFAKCATLFTVNVAFLVIGIVMYYSDSANYGEVIWMETRQWNKGAIIDLISTTNSSCPSWSEEVTGTFPGTSDYCHRPTYNTLGKCRKKSTGYTVWGLSLIEFNKLNNLLLCAVRDSDLTYHNLASMRGSMSCGNGKLCGSTSDSERRFCVTGNS